MNSEKMLDDQFLVAAIKMDSHEAFCKIFRSYYANLVMYAGQYFGDRETCEDIVQTVFARMWSDRKKLDIRQSLRSYLLRAVQNQCLDEIRHNKVKLQYESSLHRELLSMSPEDYCFYNELNSRYEDAVKALAPNDREAFLMHRTEHLKYHEIASKLGIPQRTVEDRISRALRDIRSALSDFMVIAISFNIFPPL